jgi:hypothetical protein
MWKQTETSLELRFQPFRLLPYFCRYDPLIIDPEFKGLRLNMWEKTETSRKL